LLEQFRKLSEMLLMEHLGPEVLAESFSNFLSIFKEWVCTVPTAQPIFQMVDKWVQQGLLTAAAMTSPWVAAELQREQEPFAPLA
jgi:hypothetical protein